MKERIFKNWTIVRVIYFITGIFISIQSLMSHQWFGIAFGAYFASMGLFAFGCAAGNCFGGSCTTVPPQKSNVTVQQADYEEVK